MARRRIAVIGIGMASAPHAKSLVDLADRVEVVGAFSRSQGRRQTFAERFPFPITGDLDALVGDPSIDCVLVLTPPNARTELVQRLAGSGKHILMEKPVERTTEAAEAIVATCEREGVTLGIVFQHRFREGSERLAALLADGALGAISHVQLQVPWWRPQSYYDEPGRGTIERDGGGVLISQAIHSMDLMLSLAGPVKEATAFAATTPLHRMETEDFVAGALRFETGAVGAIMATTASYPGEPERLDMVGTKAAARLEAGILTLTHLDGRKETFGETVGTGGGADPMAFPHDWHRSLITDFLDALDEGRPPRVSGREALKVHHLIDALLRASREGRKVEVGED